MSTFSASSGFSNNQHIPQVPADWDSIAGDSFVFNKPTNLSQFTDDLGISKVGFSGKYDDVIDPPTNLSQFTDDLGISKVGFSGSYPDLLNKPTIPAAQVQSNWTETVTSNADYILNKPTLAAVATTGAYTSLIGAPVASVYNANNVVLASKIWCGSALTNGGAAYFYPTTTGTTSGIALFNTITNVQTNAVYYSTNGTLIPNKWIYSYSPAAAAGIIVGCVIANGNAAANGTQIFCTVTGY